MLQIMLVNENLFFIKVHKWIEKFGLNDHKIILGGDFNFTEENRLDRNSNVNIKSKRKAMNRNWCNQKTNPALNTKAGNK